MKLKMNLYVLVSITLSLAACGNSNHSETPTHPSNGIVGGLETSKESLPARYLALIYDKPTESYCTAMLVHKRVLLTAGHCIKSTAANMTLAFGTRPLTGDYVIREASQILIHPLYKNNNINRNDLALVLIKGEAPAGYQSLALPEESFPLSANLAFTAAGYGRITGVADPKGGHGSGLLRHVELKIDSFSQDQSQFYVDQSVGKGICNGDSGGPAMMRYQDLDYVVGIASAISWLVPGELSEKAKKEYLEKHDVCSHKSIYISTKKYRLWIENGLKELLK